MVTKAPGFFYSFFYGNVHVFHFFCSNNGPLSCENRNNRPRLSFEEIYVRYMSIPVVTCRTLLYNYFLLLFFFCGNWVRSGDRFECFFFLSCVKKLRKICRHDAFNFLCHESLMCKFRSPTNWGTKT